MSIIYEINPPRISDNAEKLEILHSRIKQVSDICGGIHLTDSVLGIERISPIIIATESKRKIPDLSVTISLACNRQEFRTNFQYYTSIY